MRTIDLSPRPSLSVAPKQISSCGKGTMGALLVCFGLGQALWGQSLQLVPTIIAVAGSGATGSSGDGGPALSARLSTPLGTVHDAGGNLYIADSNNNRVQKVAYGTGIVTTIAGTGTSGFSGDGGPATNAELSGLRSVALDHAGNLYIGDSGNHRVRAMNLATGIITTVAGTGTAGYNGDGILATAAQLNGPDGLVFDRAGNLYIADTYNYRVRMVAAGTRIITTVVGTGTQGFSGDGGQATSATINLAARMALDPAGNLYLTDSANQRVRVVDHNTQVIATVAGNGAAAFSGDGGQAAAAEMNGPSDLAIDSLGDILILDTDNDRVRMITAATGVITTIAGSRRGSAGNGPALTAEVNAALGLELNNGVLYVSDSGNNQIRAIATNPAPFPGTQTGSTVTQDVYLTVAGAPTSITSFTFAPSQGGASEYTAGTVTGCTVDGATPNPVGTMCTVPVTFKPAFPGVRRLPLVVVTNGGKQNFGLTGSGLGPQAVMNPGLITSVAGTGAGGYSGDMAAATSAKLDTPRKSIVDSAGNVYVADTANNVIREIVAGTGKITTLAGNGTACSSALSVCGDGGAATRANLNHPGGVAVDAAGNLYIADTLDNRIRKVNAATGVITSIAGAGAASYTGDGGSAAAATLDSPAGVAVDLAGNIYIADTANSAIREINAGIISTVAGNGTTCSSATASCGDGAAATTANLNQPAGVAVDLFENIYVADTLNERIREVIPSTGIISTVAGSGNPGYSGDGSAATSANLSAPSDVTVDNAGNIYIADTGNHVVRLVEVANGAIVTMAGTNPTSCAVPTATCGDAGPSTRANLNTPSGVALDGAGNLYLTDTTDHRIREINASSVILTFASTASGAMSADSPRTVTLVSTGTSAWTFPAPTSGNGPVISPGFTLDPSGTCPQISAGSRAVQLAFGAACTYAVNFVPVRGGAISGTLAITDDSLNVTSPYAVQTVALSGSGTSTLTLTTSNAAPPYGQSVTFTNTIATENAVIPTGTATFYAGATVLGTSTLDATGVAAFATAALPVGTDTVTAVYSGDGNYAGGTSNAVTETVGKASGADMLTTSNAMPRFGVYITLTDTISTANIVVPTGTVNFYNGYTAIGSGTLDSTGVAMVTTNILPVGSDAITAIYAGDSNYARVTSNAVTETVGKSSAAGTLTTSNVSPASGASITLTDILPTIGGVTATGTVTFYNGAVVIGTGTLSALGVATLTTASLPSGSDSITAVYPGDSNFAGGTAGPIVENVSQSPTTDALTTSNASPNLGQAVTLTDTIPVLNGVAPTGSISFYDGVTAVGTGALNGAGQATFTTSSLLGGSHLMTAVYGGDTNYLSANAGPLTETVAKSAAADTLTASNPAPTVGMAVTFTDTIPVVSGFTPYGAVTFYFGTTAIGVGAVNASGVATGSTSSLPVGSDSITAVYGGSNNYASVTAGPIVVAVAKASGSGVLTSSKQAIALGESVLFTDTLPTLTGIIPTGVVTFYDGAMAIGTGTVSVSGIATLTIGSLPGGTDSITAVYGGDANYNSSTAGPLLETVSKLANTAVLTSSNLTPAFGFSITLTDTIAVVNGVAPTGSVTFYNGAGAIGTATVSASGVAALATASLPAGNDVITAVYGGDGNYSSSTAGPITEVVTSTVETLTASTNAITLGQNVTFTSTISLAQGVAPTGSVTFSNGTTALGTGAIDATGVATFSTAALPVGSDSITVSYAGDANHGPTSAGPVIVTVAAAPDFTISASPGDPSVAPGDAITYTVSLAGLNAAFSLPVTLSATGMPPGAVVSFMPASVVPGAGPTTTVMTIQTSSKQAILSPLGSFPAGSPPPGSLPPGSLPKIAYALLLLPLLGVRRLRRKLHATRRAVTYVFALSAVLAALGSLTGCGGGYRVVPPHQYTITVTGSSDIVQHSANVTLTVR